MSGFWHRFGTFLGELRRRKVFRVAIVYVVAVWVLATGGVDLFSAFGVPDWGIRLFVLIAVLGFPVALILAWAFEVTSSGVVREADFSEVVNGADARTKIGASKTMIGGRSGPDRLGAPSAVQVNWLLSNGETRSARFVEPFRIGRDRTCQVRMMNDRVSRNHAELYHDGRIWWVRDLNSSNGTYLNGVRIDKVPLPEKATLQFDPSGPTLRVEIEAALAATEVGQPDEASAAHARDEESGGERTVIYVTCELESGDRRIGRFCEMIRIGADPTCDVRLNHRLVEAYHAELYRVGAVWFVRDLNSAAGTFLDGAEVKQAILPRRSTLQLGWDGPALGLEVTGSGDVPPVAGEDS